MHEFWIRLLSVILIIGVFAGYNTTLEARRKDEEISRLSVQVESDQDTGTAYHYKDGVYQGEADGFGGKISVEVKVEDGRITSVDILKAEHEDAAYLSMAKDVIPDILEKQNGEVDSVSGATFSSTGIIDAAKQALEKAVQ